MGSSADPADNDRVNRIFRTLQKEMAGDTANRTYLVAQNTSHYVQLDRPDIVTDAVRSVVEAARRGASSG